MGLARWPRAYTRLVVVGLSVIATVSAGSASEALALEQKLTASDGAAHDELGYSVAIDGDTIVAGAPFDDGGKGAVYVFTRSGDAWALVAKLMASDGAAGPENEGDNLGASVAIDGDTIVAGAPGDGSVYTFARTGAAARTETAKLTASDGAGLGVSVAVDGDTIVAGSPGDDVGTNALQGSVYTFTRTGGAAARTETAKLTASDGAAGDRLGGSVAIDGDTIVAGSVLDDVGANANQGSVYTFARTGAAARTETAKLTASDGAANDQRLGWRGLGGSVAIDGDTIVVGADADEGSVYTFARTGAAARTETAKLTASDGAAGDQLGWSVAIDGDTIVAGSPFDGSVYTFARTGAAPRTETAKLTASGGAAGDRLGLSVAVGGDTIVAGSPGDDIGANYRQGSATAFTAPTLGKPQLSPRRFRAAGSGPSVAARVGTKVTYQLLEAARTLFKIQKAKPGRRASGKCVRPRPANRDQPRCVRWVTLRGKFKHAGAAGENTFRFTGRLRGRKLKPGKYRLVARATDTAGNKSAKKRSRAFRIVR